MPALENLSAPLKIFYSYSHRDKEFRKELETAVALLRGQGLIENWHDRKIVAGTDWAGEIDSHIESADIVALLISSDFIGSRSLLANGKTGTQLIKMLPWNSNCSGQNHTKVQEEDRPQSQKA